MKIAELAKKYGMTRQQILTWVKKGILPAKISEKYLIEVDDLEKFIASYCRKKSNGKMRCSSKYKHSGSTALAEIFWTVPPLNQEKERPARRSSRRSTRRRRSGYDIVLSRAKKNTKEKKALRQKISSDYDNEVLGVSAKASKDEILQAYRRLSLKYHPDKGGSSRDFNRIGLAKERMLQGRGVFRGSAHKIEIGYDEAPAWLVWYSKVFGAVRPVRSFKVDGKDAWKFLGFGDPVQIMWKEEVEFAQWKIQELIDELKAIEIPKGLAKEKIAHMKEENKRAEIFLKKLSIAIEKHARKLMKQRGYK